MVGCIAATPCNGCGAPTASATPASEQADVWKRHNPYDLAARLRSTALFVAAGNGQPGPLDLKGAVSDSLEASIGQQNRAFARQLDQLQVPARMDLYGDGTPQLGVLAA